MLLSLDVAACWWMPPPDLLHDLSVSDIVYHEVDGALYAATYGRSIWRLQVQ